MWVIIMLGNMWNPTKAHLSNKVCCMWVIRASPPVLSMSLSIIKLNVKVQLVFFYYPTNKTVTGIAYTWELLITHHLTNHCDQQIRNIDRQSGPIYYTLFFWRCTTVLHLLPATARCMNLVQKNQFRELNRHILTFSQ